MQILQHQQQRLTMSGAADELAEAVPHVPARQLRRQLDRGAECSGSRAAARRDTADLRSHVATCLRSANGLRGPLIACSIISTYGRYGGAPLISTQ